MAAVQQKQETRYQVLKMISDGCFHSGESLGATLGLSRAAVWKYIKALQELGLEIHTVRGKGYRLASPVELLDEVLIRSKLNRQLEQSLMLHIFHELESTNDFLLSLVNEASNREIGIPQVCLAEVQTKGKGRRGREWLSPYGASLACSLLWSFKKPVSRLSGLSLAVGIVLVKTLEALGVREVQLKWPNDIVSNGYKLGGILIELSGDVSGPCNVVIGIGINMHLHHPQLKEMQTIDQPWTDLTTLMYGQRLSRNQLAAALIENLINALPEFEKSGFHGYAAEWKKYDALWNQTVKVFDNQKTPADQEQYGIAAGVNESGNLILKTGQQELAIISGEVSVRAE